MYRAKRRVALILIDVIASIIFLFIAVSIVPQTKINDYRTYSNVFPTIVVSILFALVLFTSTMLYYRVRHKIEKLSLETGATALLSKFIDRLRFCYSLDDLYVAISEILENEADCAISYIDCSANYVLYNSPNKIATDSTLLKALNENYKINWPDGIFFFDDTGSLAGDTNYSRGFFFSNNCEHFFFFCRYLYLFDFEIYSRLYEEFVRFQSRSRIISSLSEISELSREWAQLAETQRSFLPATLPDVKRVKFAAYFRPLVNVSGDYYTVIPIDEHKTFIMLGDVSGKGMAAALVMGLVMNTVKISENKEDLVGTINAIDASIKNMHLQDKYTVLFMGIIDTEKMKITYINASMSDPIIVTRSPDGYRIKPLSSNCSIVGIIPLDDIKVAEQRLFSDDLILMASDGVSEVMNEEKIELGDTELYKDTIKASATKEPQEFINDIADLVMRYNGDGRLHDDVTMLVAKIQR